jgi:hypothetical protein
VLREAVANTVAGTDSPIEPPTCCPTLSSADAIPASVLTTFETAVVVSGTNSMLKPSASTIMRGQLPRIVTCEQLVEADDELRFVYGRAQQIVFKVARAQLVWRRPDLTCPHCSPGRAARSAPFARCRRR